MKKNILKHPPPYQKDNKIAITKLSSLKTTPTLDYEIATTATDQIR